MGRRAAGPLLAAGLFVATTLPTAAQQTIGVGVDYMGYAFDEGLGADAAQLLMVPVGVRFTLGNGFALDLYAAWAQGKVERDGTEYTLQGPVDAQVKASYQVGNWALVSVGAGLPTGNSGHNAEEAVVASVLATDLLGFREATWGTGFAVTSSVATAMRAGGFGFGVAGAYSVRGEFEPSADLDLSYRPGDESRIRVGVDRNFGTSTFTAGLTFMTYQEDQADGRNLFQAGNRYRADATYMFRAGAGVWTLYAADLWRENGDLTLSIVDDLGDPVGDTLITTAKQNLLVAGLVGAVGIGGSYVFRPHLDFRYQAREEADGRDEGSGWIVAAGGDIPVRLFGGYDFFPKARVLYGSIKDPTGRATNVLGAELSATVRWGM
jgi:hypothetical protein